MVPTGSVPVFYELILYDQKNDDYVKYKYFGYMLHYCFTGSSFIIAIKRHNGIILYTSVCSESIYNELLPAFINSLLKNIPFDFSVYNLVFDY